MSAIDDAAMLASEKAKVDAQFYQQSKQAEVDRLRLTKEFLDLERIHSLTKTTKIYFGPDIPSYFNAIGHTIGDVASNTSAVTHQ